jgi:hypothetical protein
VIADANGNLFGTTAYGGSGTCLLFGYNVGCGVAYELSPGDYTLRDVLRIRCAGL